MKKLLALLTVLIVALVNNLEPVQVEDMSFTDDAYYKGRTHTDVDYQSLYGSYIGESVASSDGCVTTPKSAGSISDKPTSDSGKIWFIYENSEEISKLYSDKAKEISLKAQDGDTIVAPSSCYVFSSANKSRGGTEMTISIPDTNSPRYKITFYNMARWYCCKDRKPLLKDKIDATFQHTKDARGQRLSQGDIVGYATSKTTVVIEELIDGSYEVISTKDFFDGSSN